MIYIMSILKLKNLNKGINLMNKKRIVSKVKNSNYITVISPPTPEPIKIVEFEKRAINLREIIIIAIALFNIGFVLFKIIFLFFCI